MKLYEIMCEVTASLYTAPIDLLKSIGTIAAETTSSTSNGTLISQISDQLKSATSAFIPTLQSLGFALVICFFIIQLIELTMSERLTLELFMKSFAKVGVGIGLVFAAPNIYTLLIEFADAFTSDIAGVNYSITATNKLDQLAIDSIIKDIMTNYCANTASSIWIALLAVGVLCAIIVSLVAAILIVIVYVINITRIIELNIRGCLLPIGFALLADDGWRGAGGRYIRKFLAVAAQGAALALVGKITSGILDLASNEMFTSLTELSNLGTLDGLGILVSTLLGGFAVMLAAGVASIGAMFKSQQIINDAFGA